MAAHPRQPGCRAQIVRSAAWYTEKLALARYAEEYGNEFLRMESVAKAGDDLRTLDLQDPTVREAVRDFEGGKVTALYESDAARDYV